MGKCVRFDLNATVESGTVAGWFGVQIDFKWKQFICAARVEMVQANLGYKRVNNSILGRMYTKHLHNQAGSLYATGPGSNVSGQCKLLAKQCIYCQSA